MKIYMFLGLIVIISFIIIGYYIKSCSDCKSEDTCCQRKDLKIFCSADCSIETESPTTESPTTESPTTESPTTEDNKVDCIGQWENTNCRLNDIDVICGDSQRTYTFTTTTPPINGGETCLEKYGVEIPEYLRGQLGDTLNDGDEIIEKCDSTSATALPVSYVGRVCGDCNLHEYVLENRECEPCPYAHKNVSGERKNPELVIFEGNTEDSCTVFTCGKDQRVNDDTKSCEDCGTLYGNREKDEFNDDVTTHTRAECHILTCGDWLDWQNEEFGNDCTSFDEVGSLPTERDNPGYSAEVCCNNDGTCGDWFDYIDRREGGWIQSLGSGVGDAYACSNKQINEESQSDNEQTSHLIDLGYEIWPLEKQLYKRNTRSSRPPESSGTSAETCCEKKQCLDLYNWSGGDSCRQINNDWRLKESNRPSDYLQARGGGSSMSDVFGGQCCEYGTCQDAYEQGCRCETNLRDTFPDLWDDTEGVDQKTYIYDKTTGSDPDIIAVRSCYTGNRFDQWVLTGAQKAGNSHDDGKCLYFQRECCEFPAREYTRGAFNRFDGHQLKSCLDSGYRTSPRLS